MLACHTVRGALEALVPRADKVGDGFFRLRLGRTMRPSGYRFGKNIRS